MVAFISARRHGAALIDLVFVAAGASALLAGNAIPARAASTVVNAMVVPGYEPPVAAPQPSYIPPPSQTSARGGYGGGFLELLVNAGAPSRLPDNVIYNRPQAGPAAAASRGLVAYAQPQQNYEPRRTVDPAFQRAEVDYPSSQAPGTIVVDTVSKHLYLVQGGGHATRYGIGVGRPGFAWSGVKSISRKAEWPDWTPPAEMLLRRPDLPRHMAGGPANPLGARALYSTLR